MADDEQFSLCWNNFNTNLSAGFHESLIQGDLVDVTLAAEGQLVKAHRLILSVCSPYFRKMFTQMPANQHAFIFLKDVSHSALKDLIQFMYCGEVNVKQDALPAFISTAEALQIKGLTETGESAPAQQSPAKDTSHHLPSSGVTTIPSSASSPRAKPLQRSRIQSYKIDSDNESEHEKVVQIQATSTPATASSSSSGPSATIVTSQISTAPQQVQIIQQQQQAQKRSLQQRASITPQTTQVLKRAKLSDPLEASEPAQIQTVQIVKQITQTPQQTISSEAEYVEMPIETINPKAEPDYADDPSEVEAIETEHEHEHEHEQALTEHEAAEHDQDADDNYVEDETYGDMAKYDESYFTEGEEVKAGASGFGSESYTESGTAADQAAQGTRARRRYRKHVRSDLKAKPGAGSKKREPYVLLLPEGKIVGVRTGRVESVGKYDNPYSAVFDIEHILLDVDLYENRNGADILNYLRQGSKLTDSENNELVRICCEHLQRCDGSMYPNTDKKEILAKSIVYTFPQLANENYPEEPHALYFHRKLDHVVDDRHSGKITNRFDTIIRKANGKNRYKKPSHVILS